MNILIRSSVGKIPEISTGHLFRSILLGNLLKKKNKKLNIIYYFDTNYKKQDILNLINDKRKRNIFINKKNNSFNELNFILKKNPKLVIFDTFGTNKYIVKNLKRNNIKTVSFDDKNYNLTKCDLVINSILYKSKPKSTVNLKEGYNYLLLDTIKFRIENKKNIKNIFVFFGGFDYRNLTIFFLNLLFKINYNAKYTIFLKHSNLQELKKIKLIFSKINKLNRSNFILYNHSISFINTIKKQDLIICNGGLALLQSISIGLPVISIPQYKHQISTINILRKKGIPLIKYNSLKISKTKIIKYFKNIVSNENFRKKFLYNGPKIINYKSNDRVINLIFKLLE